LALANVDLPEFRHDGEENRWSQYRKGADALPRGQAESPRKWENNLDRKLSTLTLFAAGSARIFQRRSDFGGFILTSCIFGPVARAAGLSFWLLFLAEDDFALANELIIEPEPVFIGCGLQAGAGRAA
jgi:hypothetical protein